MAAGAGALGIAFVTSVIFNYLVLTMWQRKIGDIYADAVKGRTPKLRLGDVLAGVGKTPGAGSGNLTIGDPSMLAALTPDTLGEIAERKARIRDHIESAGKRFLIFADTTNHYVVSLAKPDWYCVFDMDAEAAVVARKKILDMIAADKIASAGYHMPFPAVGYVDKQGSGYRWVPASYQLDL